MMDANDRLPTNKPEPMRTTDWILLGILILLLAVTFPLLWWIYSPLLWWLLRFMVPLAVLGFIGYFALRAVQLGEAKGTTPADNFAANLRKAWMESVAFIRKYFKRVTITFIVITLLFVGGAVGYTKYSKQSVTEKQLARMTHALEKHKQHFGSYPTTLAELVGNDPLKREWFQDSWGNKMNYALTKNGAGYLLSSDGKDGVKGTADDLTSSI